MSRRRKWEKFFFKYEDFMRLFAGQRGDVQLGQCLKGIAVGLSGGTRDDAADGHTESFYEGLAWAERVYDDAQTLHERRSGAIRAARPKGPGRSTLMAAARARGTHSPAEWQEMLSASGNQCLCCGYEGVVCKDHVVPVSLGGSDHITNLQPLCRQCNSQKGSTTLDMRIGEPWMRPEWLPESHHG